MTLLEEERWAIEPPHNWYKFLSVALIFPNSYELGMSNLGFQSIYRLLNERQEISCERAFYPFSQTLETERELNRYDCVCISISFELDLPNMLSLLNKSNIPLNSGERREKDPLVIIGGTFASINPELLTAFADIIVIGEAEENIYELFNQIHDWRAFSLLKAELFEKIAHIDGIYVPGYNSQKNIQILKSLNGFSTFSPIITPNAHFANTFLVEMNRGCPYRCRFCAVGEIFSPFREYEFEKIWGAIELGRKITNKIGLVGSAIGSVSYFGELLERLNKNNLEVGLSSFRADQLTPKIAKNLGACGIKTLTIAPEAGSERMRKFIKKGLSEEKILQAAKIIRNTGVTNVKLYFIIGFPEESQEDLLSIIELSKKIQKIAKANIHISINPFVPKPKTFLGSYPMEKSNKLKKKYKIIKKELRSENRIRVTFESIRLATIQALLSKGDERLKELLIMKATTDKNWNDCLRDTQIEIDQYIY